MTRPSATRESTGPSRQIAGIAGCVGYAVPMTLFATRMAVVGTALGALASAALMPVAHAQPPPLVVVGFTSDPAPEGAPAATLPVDPSSVRAEMSRALRTFVVAPEAADAHGVAPQVVAVGRHVAGRRGRREVELLRVHHGGAQRAAARVN